MVLNIFSSLEDAKESNFDVKAPAGCKSGWSRANRKRTIKFPHVEAKNGAKERDAGAILKVA
jgi:hypothetical protein